MGKHGYTGHIGVYRVYGITRVTWAHKIYRGIKGIQFHLGKHWYTGYIGVYRVYSITRVNVGTQDI